MTNRIIHPQYSPNSFDHDIGLLRLPYQVPANPAIVPVRLQAQFQTGLTYTNETTIFTGFLRGGNSVPISQGLRYTESRVIPLDQCAETFENCIVNSNTLCTLGLEFDIQGPCANDNRGPLVFYEFDNVPTIIGVQSFFASGGCTAGQPVGFLRLGQYVQWISQQAYISVRP